ncbi:MAG: SCP2 sterol-binding domain-containing protein [Deltaproteobacteria bacterium]|jgi:putative sterol carrier protein|nr:SCP2 sterol-binding domain-containing protein [Myxococcales bacterium]MBP6608585.1 SCP2 sterol-binding domain-containing protein [Deltaproteobacteria bacterium]
MAVPTSASDLFDTLLPPKIAATPDKAREINAIYQFNITGENGGQWNVDLAGNPPSITKGEKPGANCTITVAHEDFLKMLTNPALGMQLFMTGKLKVAGDPMLAMKLQKLFSLS